MVPALALLALLSPPARLAAQTEAQGLAGLGRLMQPLDARARALGGAGVTLHLNLSVINPAALARIGVPGIWVTFMPEHREFEGEAVAGAVDVADFPLFRVSMPFGRNLTVGAAFGSFLDQDFGVEFTDTLRLSSGDVAFAETRTWEGGVSQFRLEFGYAASEHWALGAALQYYFGATALSTTRVFDAASGLLPYESTVQLDWQGWGITAGVEWSPIPEMILGAAASWGAKLDAEDDSAGTSKEYSLPIGIDVGGSWQLVRGVLVAVTAGWADWSSVAEDLGSGGGADVWRLGAGTELQVLERGGTTVLARLGGRMERSPFLVGGDPPWERALAIGLGVRLREGLGSLDATVERGKRGSVDANGVEELFTRYTLSVTVFSR
jgi:hypothetical protein